MIFHETPLPGSRLVDLNPLGDARGFFARVFCAEEFAAQGLETSFVQANASWSAEKGTLRGMHYQLPAASEVKLVRCVRGTVWDVILDLRPDSATYGKSFGAELTADNRRAMYVPRGFAHGFQTLVSDCELFYLVSAAYAKSGERGVRWNDPRFGIAWPMTPTEISDKDRSWPDFDPTFHGIELLRGL
jgi:dTDP-4-dehydrorhamnose 3,5-epimerase